MANPIALASELSQRVVFNSGHVDFGTDFGIVNLESVTIETSVAEKQLRRLNSIKMAALKRATFQVTLRGKVKSVNRDVFKKFFGESSSDGSGTMIRFHDGQQDTLNPIFTAYVDDDTNKAVQFQFTDAVIRTMPLNAALEEYAEVDFEMVARDLKVWMFE
jgi:hypothetical protein